MPVFAENREIVTPGTMLAKGDYAAADHTYKIGDGIYSTHIGLVKYSGTSVGIIALAGSYMPKIGDVVIGKVVNSSFSHWEIDINSPQLARLEAIDRGRGIDLRRDDLSKLLSVGSLVVGKVRTIKKFGPVIAVYGRGLGDIKSGRIVRISPAKVPRLIGRAGSMIKMLVEKTRCDIKVGQNGIVVVNGKNPLAEEIAIAAIKQIEKEAHTIGLTDRISAMMAKELGE